MMKKSIKMVIALLSWMTIAGTMSAQERKVYVIDKDITYQEIDNFISNNNCDIADKELPCSTKRQSQKITHGYTPPHIIKPNIASNIKKILIHQANTILISYLLCIGSIT